MSRGDLYTCTERVGNVWFGVVCFPGKTRDYVRHVSNPYQRNGDPIRFDTQAKASQAASDVMCAYFRNRTTGYASEAINKSKMDAEALFKNA